MHGMTTCQLCETSCPAPANLLKKMNKVTSKIFKHTPQLPTSVPPIVPSTMVLIQSRGCSADTRRYRGSCCLCTQQKRERAGDKFYVHNSRSKIERKQDISWREGWPCRHESTLDTTADCSDKKRRRTRRITGVGLSNASYHSWGLFEGQRRQNRQRRPKTPWCVYEPKDSQSYICSR